MGYLNNLLRKVKQMDIPDIAATAVAESEEAYADLQRQQFLHGLDSQGNPIGQYKQQAYADYKWGKNQLAGYGQVDLKNEGSFYDRITASVVGDAIVVESTDGKAAEIDEKYNADGQLWGLHGEFRKQMAEEIKPALYNEIRKATGLR